MATKAVRLQSGLWCIRVQYFDEDGTLRNKRITASSRERAERLAAQFAQTPKPERDISPADMTVRDAIASYIHKRKQTLLPSSIQIYRKYQRNHFDSVAHLKITALTLQDAQRLVDVLAPGRTAKTVREIYYFFCSAIREHRPGFKPPVRLPPLPPRPPKPRARRKKAE